MESVAPPYSLQLWPLAAVGCCGLFALLAPGCAPAVAALRLGFSVRVGSTSRLMASLYELIQLGGFLQPELIPQSLPKHSWAGATL